MKRKLLLLVTILTLLALPLSVGAYTVDLSSHEGLSGGVLVDVIGDGTDELTFDLTLAEGTFADMRAFYFNIDGNTSISEIIVNSVTDANNYLTESSVITAGPDADNVANNADMSGTHVEFEYGIEFGNQGIAQRKGDINAINFTVIGDSVFNLDDNNLGMRLMSFGDDPDDREGSRKMLGSYVSEDIPEEIVEDPPPVNDPPTTPGGDTPGSNEAPEPATMFLLGSGLLALAGYRKKFANKK